MRINVFVIDDSAVMRQLMSEAISKDGEVCLSGSAPDPLIARRKMEKNWPDVILLDIEMPKMDGITFLKQIMSERPTPVVICSTLTEKGAARSLEALSSGAVEVVNKPNTNLSGFLNSTGTREILDAIKAAGRAKVKKLKFLAENSYREKIAPDSVIEPAESKVKVVTEQIIVIGASTGGTEAILSFLKNMPVKSPPIAIVQHMPEAFTSAFAQRLAISTPHSVMEAKNGAKMGQGCVYIAPGGKHLLIRRQGNGYFLEIKDGPLVSRHKPSVDVLFRSAAQSAGANAIGIILTGMGDDGAIGMLEMKRAGSMTFAECESSCVVFGMPKEAIAKGGVQKVYSLGSLPYQVQKYLEF
ncbi:chemotaxis response regulator protein-glutamate methylesterase [Vibrio hannami]|uniref:protein-glutamate methylesterase/protein-glutamine glutaminase n=1 Tax=Vibrio hannami TaxID=2717094 RepID=UPI00240F6193|nr:chemotaxis response regulator protein-glutamate methylesterase [Vibrio hannami]MDG3087922.1 chemotaxis response regulator protein-glutamate methylesterase [Vibrio hannami]